MALLKDGASSSSNAVATAWCGTRLARCHLDAIPALSAADTKKGLKSSFGQDGRARPA
eukprot:CAMPEP_0181529272 /NCGR_PEP_ID=MMETSP1110-20121109/70970_1 /TAXON_ID=174948 /ORGANISM="Symbiodinium sp., Strain CCMP421" /LENGTH=57 /DNA_ID=CAMNT_0023660247 /DNA_START=170 /DNA_END=343 /DNA_ORIENTATION=+